MLYSAIFKSTPYSVSDLGVEFSVRDVTASLSLSGLTMRYRKIQRVLEVLPYSSYPLGILLHLMAEVAEIPLFLKYSPIALMVR